MIVPPATIWLESHQRRGPHVSGPHVSGPLLARSFCFTRPDGAVTARAAEQLPEALAQVEAAVSRGLHAVGFVTYEAAVGCDAALATHTPTGALPAAWFGLYHDRRQAARDQSSVEGFALGPWQAAVDEAGHARALGVIRDYIGAGDVYQVNYTFPLRATFDGDPTALYGALCRAQGGAAFCACLDLGDLAVLSASPELFFAVDAHGRLRARPMKGTRPRGRWTAEDDALCRDLAASEKDRAENLMIVDLLRNDLGRVAHPGSVSVPALWQVEPYDTVWQMTSSIEGRLRGDVSLAALFGALFPCGSITGAPKVRATQIIRELEAGPRGIYTGAVGYVSPTPAGAGWRGLEAVFNVAIRTVTVDRRSATATAGVGGGITWDSLPKAEWAECRHKARFLDLVLDLGTLGAAASWGGAEGKGGRLRQTAASLSRGPQRAPAMAPAGDSDFGLLETLLFEPGDGFYLVEQHLRRLADSARYFGFAIDLDALRQRLAEAVDSSGAAEALRVRLTLARDGALQVTAAPMDAAAKAVWTVVEAPLPVHSSDVFLYHKTTRRQVYERSLAAARSAGADEVVLRNESGEWTECAVGNLVLDIDGQRWTPPLRCGLLGGVYRQYLLERGDIAERVLTAADARAADAIWLINSVRRWVRLDMRWPGDARTDQGETPCTG